MTLACCRMRVWMVCDERKARYFGWEICYNSEKYLQRASIGTVFSRFECKTGNCVAQVLYLATAWSLSSSPKQRKKRGVQRGRICATCQPRLQWRFYKFYDCEIVFRCLASGTSRTCSAPHGRSNQVSLGSRQDYHFRYLCDRFPCLPSTSVAQRLEHWTFNPRVAGSNPVGGVLFSFFLHLRPLFRSKARDLPKTL